ncbi:MAG: lactate utilization protein [Nitrosomonas sp.]|nr:lactate utilization protein [Nitrosomonas sp.]
MNDTRKAILNRLNHYQLKYSGIESDAKAKQTDWGLEEKVKRFTARMQAVQAEVHEASLETWPEVLQEICHAKAINNLLASPSTRWGKEIYADAKRFPSLKRFQQPVEAWKTDFFNTIEAAVTGSAGGIAETGSLILCPDMQEPRTLSLVPPIHIALLEKKRIYNTLSEAIHQQNWVQTGMPTNVILISGPSKSADIEQTMTYGVHGPKELIILLV